MGRGTSCQDFHRRIYHFQADELPENEHRELREHIEVCPPCARLLDCEQQLLAGLKRRLRRSEAPPELLSRCRESLRREAPAPSLTGWIRAPWMLPVAASLLLSILAIPLAIGVGGPWIDGGVVTVDRQVTVVDMQCELAGRTLAEQRRCRDPHHLNALKVDDERYWNVSLADPAGRALVVDETMRGHRLRVQGDLYTAIRTVWLRDVENLGLRAASALDAPAATLVANFPAVP